MKTSDIKKIFHQQIQEELVSIGWLFSSKHSMYYRINNNVLSFILIDRRSSGFEVGIYIQPLYIPNENLVLNLGDSIQHINYDNYYEYVLLPTLDEKEIKSNIIRLKEFILGSGISWLNKVGSPDGICDSIFEKNKMGRWFFTSDVWRHEAAAYSKLYLGDLSAARFHFDQFCDQLKVNHSGKWVQDTINYTHKLMHAADINPSHINCVLTNNVLQLKKVLHIC